MVRQILSSGARLGMICLLAVVAFGQGAADADYCNVALVPSLSARLGLDLPTRIALAHRGADLVHRLQNGSGHDSAMSSANAVADLAGSKIVARCGREVKDVLPKDARQSFDGLFAGRKIAPVKFWTKRDKSSIGSGQLFLTFGWEGMTPEEIEERKSLRGYERWLGRCRTVIPSADAATELLAHEDEEVREAAKAWLKAPEDPGSRPTADEIHAEVLRLRAESERLTEESRQRSAESQRAWEEKMRARAAEREKWLAEREIESEASRARHEEMRARGAARAAEAAERREAKQAQIEETWKRLERNRQALRDKRARHAKLRAQAEAKRKKAEGGGN